MLAGSRLLLIPCETAAALFFSPFRAASDVPSRCSLPRSLTNSRIHSEIPESEGRPTYHHWLVSSLSHRRLIINSLCSRPGFYSRELAGSGDFNFNTVLGRPVVHPASNSSPSPSFEALVRDGFNASRASFVSLKQRRPATTRSNNSGGSARRLGLPMALRLRLLLVVAVVAWSFRPGVAYPPAVSVLPGLPVAGLAVGFYNASCPQVEDLVLAEMRAIVEKDWTLGPALLRFMFHDCLVRGCDASIMLISRNGTGERDAAPSYGLRGYDEIEHIKAKVEEACPLTVSCADIIAIAARDAVHLSNGPRYPVETGRRDGKGSAMCDADNDLPPPFSNIVDLKTYFSVKGLGWKDLVVLSGSHTIGRAQCSTFASDRLYNYSGDGGQDPSLDKAYAATLREACEAGLSNDTTEVCMDPATPRTFDLGYYRDVLSHRGLFLSDQALMDDRWTRAYVERMAAAESPDEFFADYALAMTNMGRIEVLTGANGEIRKVCAAHVD